MRPRLTRPRLQLAAGLAAVVAVTGLGIALTDAPVTTGDTDVVIAEGDPMASTTDRSADTSTSEAPDRGDATSGPADATTGEGPVPGSDRSTARRRSGTAPSNKTQKDPRPSQRRPNDAPPETTAPPPAGPDTTQQPTTPAPCTADDLEVLLQPLLPDAAAEPKAVGLAPKIEVRGPRSCTTAADDRWVIEVFDDQGREVFHFSRALDDAGAPPRVHQPGDVLLLGSVWPWYLDCAYLPPLDPDFFERGDRRCADSVPGTFAITFSAAGVDGRLFPADIGPAPGVIVVP